MGEPCLPNIDLWMAATGGRIPPRRGNRGPALNDSLLITLRVMDEQDHINRFDWMMLPRGINRILIERILFYRGQAALVYVKEKKEFYFLPFVGESIDVYGRWKTVRLLPFTGSSSSNDDGGKSFLDGRTWEPIYDIIDPAELVEDDMYKKCVIFRDYSQQLSQTVIPRWQLQDPLLQVMAETIPLARTALINNAGVDGVRVNAQDEESSVMAAASAVTKAALNGDRWVPLMGSMDFQELSGRSAGQVQDYLLALQSLDNLRLSLHGLSNGGVFLKNSHMLVAEQKMNDGNASLIYRDGLKNRQWSCDLANSLWGLGMWCEASESVTGFDKDLDGDLIDDEDAAIGAGGEMNVD